MRKIIPYGRTYLRRELELYRQNWRVYPCAKCGSPVADGYCCGHCGTDEPDIREADDE